MFKERQSTLKVASVQFDVRLADVDANLDIVIAEISRLTNQGVRLIVLPEMWSTGYAWRKLRALSDRTPEVVKALQQITPDGTVVIGSMPEMREDKLYNTAFIIDGDKPPQTCQKTHLFTPMKEHFFLEKGTASKVFHTSVGRIGVLICYDLRFPELARKLAVEGAEILVVPAQWPHPRLDHWETLLKARSIENQLFVAAANRCGRQGIIKFCGHSIIINPWGEIKAEAGEGQETIAADLDFSDMTRYRKDIPVLRDRRPDIYN